MRISGGVKKGIVLRTDRPSPLLRPLTDKIKNALFSIISEKIKDSNVLDLFTGTGIFGFEALSRGAESVTFVDRDRRNIRLIRENVHRLQFDERVTAINKDFREAIDFLKKKNRSFSLVFIDPPYNTDFAYQTITHPSFLSLVRQESLVIVRVHHKKELPPSVGNMFLTCQRRYGEAKIYFYTPREHHP